MTSHFLFWGEEGSPKKKTNQKVPSHINLGIIGKLMQLIKLATSQCCWLDNAV